MRPITEVLVRPVITEKSHRLQEQRKYAFEVSPRVTKREIRQAVEQAFNVKTSAVHIVKMRGRIKHYGRRSYQSKDWKKAVVTLTEGHKIDFIEGV